MSKDGHDNKVVPFPSHKIKKPKAVKTETSGQSGASVRKTTFFISLVATILMATMLTSRLNNQKGDYQARGIASQTRELQEDIILAKKIARESLREPASRGREPTAEDILRHGELAGLYALRFSDSGALVALDYSGQPGSERYVTDRGEFIERNSDLMRIEFTSYNLSESIQDNGFRFEVYDLKRDNQVRARVHFKVDDKAHLYSMKVESDSL